MQNGHPDDQWEQLIQAGHDVMVDIARDEGVMTYAQFNEALCSATGLPRFDFSNPGSLKYFSRLLADIVKQDPMCHQFMISAVVKLAPPADGPGSGFFVLAKSLDYPDPMSTKEEKEAFWLKQLAAAHNHHNLRRRHRLRVPVK